MTDFNQKTHDTDVGSHGGQSRQMMEVFENQEFGSIRVLQEAGKTFLEDISQRQEQLWEGVKEILTQLSKLS